MRTYHLWPKASVFYKIIKYRGTILGGSPEDMANTVPAIVEAGANIIGGCCGTTPAHISAIKKAVKAI